MKCPNCNKEYHWCFSCGWEAGGVACSYDCAWELWDKEEIPAEDMLLWAFERIYELEIARRQPTFRKAKTVKVTNESTD